MSFVKIGSSQDSRAETLIRLPVSEDTLSLSEIRCPRESGTSPKPPTGSTVTKKRSLTETMRDLWSRWIYEGYAMSKLSRLAGIAVTACLFPWVGFAQDNSFAMTIQNGAMWQSNLTKQMINLGGTPASGGGGRFSPANCMPPVDLQRGVDGHVPPELQGDPRYQEYLRCKQGIPPQGASTTGAPQFPVATHHLPITATDFMPARPGHPTVDEAIANMSITPEQRQQVHDGVDKAFRHIATQYRGNNLAVSVAAAYTTSMITLSGSQMTPQQIQEFIYGVNDQLAQNPQFPILSAQEKQDESDKFIFQAAIIAALQDAGRTNPEAKQQSLDLSRVVLGQFGVW